MPNDYDAPRVITEGEKTRQLPQTAIPEERSGPRRPLPKPATAQFRTQVKEQIPSASQLPGSTVCQAGQGGNP